MMKQNNSRRDFIRNLATAAFSVLLAFSFFKPGKASRRVYANDQEGRQIARINPAFSVNIFADGTAELYTHNRAGERMVTRFEGLQSDILVKILEETDPGLCYEELGPKYNLDKSAYASDVLNILKSLEEKGFIYYGDLLQVKIREG